MNAETLIDGMKFAKKHNLTQKEIEVLVPFLETFHTTAEVAELLKMHKTSLHHIIQRLKLKCLLILKDRDSKGTNLYEFNQAQIED
ncbi:hypothetical protein LCGC14_1837840 [marine sediment metagenome]|uniref:HTH arsR-type domain-containing protein n=1 Tax=marine sediment metagenome TaxID=412755 RepID=A0A0F9GE51_9ZZZZ